MSLVFLVIAVAAGGAIGGVLRFLVTGWVTRLSGEGFPWGTLVVNVSGAAALGLLTAAVTRPEPSLLYALLGVGLLGSYTTVSSFALQTLTLLKAGRLVGGLYNVGLTVGLGVVAAYGGYRLGVLIGAA